MRTHGQRHGPITRLMSPSDFGRFLKPYVFLDLFDNQGKPFTGFGLHPHSGIATLYSFGFSSTKAALAHNAPGVNLFGNNHPNEPGPPHGCFSRDGADAEYDGHYSRQVLDCLSMLAPPLRLATMAFLTARNGLRTNTAAQLADLTGGEFFHFSNAKDLREALITVTHDVMNYYVLSFHPATPTPGLHALHLEITGHSQLTFKSRPEYWIDEGVN